MDSPNDDFDYCIVDLKSNQTEMSDNHCDSVKKRTNLPSVAIIFLSNFLTGIGEWIS